MTEDDFIDILALLEEDGKITEAEADELLRQYRAGEIDESEMPLLLGISAIALATLFASTSGTGAVNVVGDAFEERAASAASTGTIAGVAAFQAEASTLIQDAAAQVAAIALDLEEEAADLEALGLPSDELDAILFEIEEAVTEQYAYLERFSAEVMAAQALGRPMSEAQISARLALYFGALYALYWRLSERGTDEGIVYDYISEDDAGTCDPCLAAEAGGPYLANDGPYPGEVCLGRGRCRCERRARLDLDAYNELIGR